MKITEKNDITPHDEGRLSDADMEKVVGGADYSALLHPIDNTVKIFSKLSEPFRFVHRQLTKGPTYDD